MWRAMVSSGTPDFTTLARKPSERLAIVAHVRDTPTLEETDYLEWKSAYNLSTRPGAAAIARQLIGMANRDLAHAAVHAEGSAYVLVGVEPGALHGVAHWDSADIENWLARYVQSDLRYHVDYVGVDGKEVLVFTVDAPRQGDPIYCLQRQCDVDEIASSGAGETETRIKKTLPKGAIYVRHGGKTEQHTPEDLARLTARAAIAERPTLDVAVTLDASNAAVIGDRLVSAGCRDTRLRAWREKKLATLPRSEPEPKRGSLDLMGLTALDYSPRFSKPLGEMRSAEEFENEVERYMHVMTDSGVWLRAVARDWVQARRSVLGVSVQNNTGLNYENAVIEMTLIGLTRANVFATANEAAQILSVPEEPADWGDASFIPTIAANYAATTIAEAARSTPQIEEPDKGRVLVCYPELRIRPHTTHRLEPLLLALAPFMAGESVAVHWRVTASNTDGHQEGDITYQVPTLAESNYAAASEVQTRT